MKEQYDDCSDSSQQTCTFSKASSQKNIFLIGFMGTGKSTIGRQLANCMQRPFIDTDYEIEQMLGKSIYQVFNENGEGYFRKQEALLCQEKLVLPRGYVVATGGGMVLNPENVACMRASGVLIALRASPEIIYERVQKGNRPLLKGDIRQQLEKLLLERAGAYEWAEFTVDTGRYTAGESVQQILQYLKERDHLDN